MEKKEEKKMKFSLNMNLNYRENGFDIESSFDNKNMIQCHKFFFFFLNNACVYNTIHIKEIYLTEYIAIIFLLLMIY